MFTQTFLAILIQVALLWTGLGAVTLIVMLIRDWRNGQLW